MKYFLVLCILIGFLHGETHSLFPPSSTEDIASLFSEQIAGIVSPIGGQISSATTDLIAKGAVSLPLTRYYTPPRMHAFYGKSQATDDYYAMEHLKKSFHGWQTFPHLHIEEQGKTIRVTESNGMTLLFEYRSGHKKMEPLTSRLGLHNLQGDEPSGKHYPGNIRCYGEKGGKEVLVVTPDGNTRIYKKKKGKKHKSVDTYQLEKEKLPTGHIKRYWYKKDKLASVEILDPKEKHLYARIAIDGDPEQGSVTYTTGSNDTASYFYEQTHLKGVFKTGYFSKKQFDELTPPRLERVTSPFYPEETMGYCLPKSLLVYRSGRGPHFSSTYRPTPDDSVLRVEEILLPSSSDELEVAYKLQYTPTFMTREGVTEVTNPDGTITIYHFSDLYLMKQIEYCDSDKNVKREKLFEWDESGYIKSIEVKGLYKRKFTSDKYGNPTRESLKGDLTGSGQIDTLTTKRLFSKDKRNLLLEEHHENGLSLHMSYLSDTNLLTEKRVYLNGNLSSIETHKYDENNNLIETAIKEGGRKRKTKFILRQSYPFIHMHEEIYNLYEEDGEEKLLNHIYLHYDGRGNIRQEDHYDANDAFTFSIYKKYNERNELVFETNPIGQIATYEYDNQGNLTKEIPFSETLKKEMRYDRRGRLIEESNLHTATYAYDKSDRLLEIADTFGNTTFFTYDPISSKVSKVISGEKTTSSTYDNFGRETSKTDANGNTTYFRHTATGLVSEITHPSGGKETFLYTKEGKLTRHTLPDGNETIYTYDGLGRILTKNTDGATEYFCYSGNFLTSYTDPEGFVTTYTYDGAGRKIKEMRAGKTITYGYNSLSHLAFIDEDLRTTYFERDLLGRVTKEILGDQIKEFTYDSQGNIASITRDSAIETFTYDPLNRLTEHKDPLGNIKTTTYIETDHLEIIQTDPRGITSHEIFDRYGNSIVNEIKGVKKIHRTFDPMNNLIEEIEDVFLDGSYQKSLITSYAYNNQNLLASKTNSQNRMTRFFYTKGGKLKTTQKPSGVQIHYTYGPFGLLRSTTSSDGSVDYTLTYNKLGQLTGGTGFTRTLDPFGNILKETFSNGLTIQKTYDSLNRPLTLTLPDQRHITYTYDDLHLRKVNWGNYTHTYDTFGPRGEILKETNHERKINKAGLYTDLTSSNLTESLTFDASGNITKITSNNITTTYNYDPLSQLTTEGGKSYPFDSHYTDTSETFIPHNLDGNRLAQDNYTLTFDALGQLIKATDGKTTLTFTYDALGRRLTKNRDLYLYDSHTEIASFSPHLKELRIIGLSGQAIALELNQTLFIPIYDLTRNPRFLINPETLQIAASYTFSAFGEPIQIYDSTSNPWRYAAKRHDPELNLIYFGRRYYDPPTKRWLTEDPLGAADTPNLYTFLRNNPFRYIDPLGLLSENAPPKGPPPKFYLDPKGEYSLYPLSNTFTVGSFQPDRGPIVFIPGISNSYQDTYNSATKISKLGNGAKVHCIYNASDMLLDLPECFFGILKIPSYATYLLTRQLKELFSPDKSTLLISNSGGAIHVRNALSYLPESHRNRIISVSFAPGTIIPKELCSSSHNYTSKRDFVSYLAAIQKVVMATGFCTPLAIKAYQNAKAELKQLIVLEPHPDAPFWDHPLASPTFEGKLTRHIKDHLNGDI